MNVLSVLAHLGPVAGSIAFGGAVISMTTLQLRTRQRYRIMEERLAKCLVEGLRNGALDFDQPLPENHCNVFQSYPDEADETQLQLIPSRYRILGYPGRSSATSFNELPAPSRILQVRLLGSGTSNPDENLLLGVPKAYLADGVIDQGHDWWSEDAGSPAETGDGLPQELSA
jgi:hypothetical protein